MDRLFQSFSQVDASVARRYGGTGLGLAISQRLAELMDGSLMATSSRRPRRGQHVPAAIPCRDGAEGVPTEAPQLGSRRRLAGRRALIVDDNATNRRILVAQTRAVGAWRSRDAASAEGGARRGSRGGESFDVGAARPEHAGAWTASPWRSALRRATRKRRVPVHRPRRRSAMPEFKDAPVVAIAHQAGEAVGAPRRPR